ncbi:MAG: methyltransferase domain-containing protein [Alphaproteobacteria bacterium]
MRNLYVNYGCGSTAPDGWLNFDASPTLIVERMPIVRALLPRGRRVFPDGVRRGDIVAGLPVADGSCAGVFASHVLEHLTLDACRIALVNTRRLLRPGGVFRLVVPDLAALVGLYVQATAEGRSDAAPLFMRESLLGEERAPQGPIGHLRQWFGHSRHLWMWDYPSLREAVLEAGFATARRCVCGDAADPAFAAVEQPERFTNAVAIEAVR